MENKNIESSKVVEDFEKLDQRNQDKLDLLNKKFDEEQEDQENRLLFDFDEVIKEVEAKPFTIKFQGQYYEVPPQMPLDFSMFFFRHCFIKRNGKQVIECPDDKMSRFIELMIGKKFLSALERSQNKVTINSVMENLAMPILEKWGYGVVKKGDNQSNQSKKK